MVPHRDAAETPGPRLVEGVRAPLFDRLADERHPDPGNPTPPRPFLVHSQDLKRSIERELSALLNTRTPVDVETLARRERSTIDYGIPDLSLYAPDDAAAHAMLGEHLKRAIEAYEPRLSAPQVRVERDPARAGGLVAMITGHLALDESLERIEFRFGLGAEDG